MYSGREFQMRAADGTKYLLWLTRLERGIWTAKSCDLTERLRTKVIPLTTRTNTDVYATRMTPTASAAFCTAFSYAQAYLYISIHDVNRPTNLVMVIL